MTYEILPPAREEFKKAFAYYEGNESGLGNKFSGEFYAGLNHILSSPQAWTEIEAGVRRYLTEKFPYAILYHVLADEQKILVIAIAHQRQKPGYWRDRKF